MIGHDNAVHASVHRRVRVLDGLDALEHDGPIPVIAQELEVFPRAENARGGLNPPHTELNGCLRLRVASSEARPECVQVQRECRTLVNSRRQAHPFHEDWVRRSDLCSYTGEEGKVSLVEVVRSPSDHESVHGDHERSETSRLGTAQKRECEVVVQWPAPV